MLVQLLAQLHELRREPLGDRRDASVEFHGLELSAMVLRPLQGQFAAELIGLRLPVDDAIFAAVEAAWTRHPLLVFRDLEMTPEQHIAFSRRFGDLHIMEPLQYNLPGYPEIFVVSNVEEGGKALGMKRAGWGWHTDGEDKPSRTPGRCFMRSSYRPRAETRCLPTCMRPMRL